MSQKVGIDWTSLFWVFVVGTAANVVGHYLYHEWVKPCCRPLPLQTPVKVQLPFTGGIVSVQNPNRHHAETNLPA